jgi:hypothetical protein
MGVKTSAIFYGRGVPKNYNNFAFGSTSLSSNKLISDE